MKKSTILTLLALYGLSYVCSAQTESIIGKNLITGEEIVAEEYGFRKRIHDFHIYYDRPHIALELREVSPNGKWLDEDGTLMLYDLSTHTTVWSAPILYARQRLIRHDNLIFYADYEDVVCFDLASEQRKYCLKHPLRYVDFQHNIGISVLGRQSNTLLSGIDLETGAELWKRKIKKDYGLDEIAYLNDSTVLVAASGLHAVNLYDGRGWSYEAVTGKKDYSTASPRRTLGFLSGALVQADTGIGIYTVSYGYDLINGFVSNIVTEKDNIYFADRRQLTCFDTAGGIRWRVPFKRNYLSKSYLTLRGDTLIMVNMGYVISGNAVSGYGTSFIAAYDARTGEELFRSHVGLPEHPIRDFILGEESIVLLFGHKIAEFSLTDGYFLAEKFFDDIGLDECAGFAADDTFVKTDGVYVTLKGEDSEITCLVGSEKTLVFGERLEIMEEIESDRLYKWYASSGNYMFMGQREETVVLDINGKEVAYLQVGCSAFLKGYHLYEVRDNHTIVDVDLSDLLRGTYIIDSILISTR